MKNYKYLLAFILIVSWVLTPLISISQMKENPKKDSYTLDVIEASPSNFEVNNGTVLFSGSINTYSETGKEFKKEHTQIAQDSIAMIDELSMNFARTKQLNEEYLNQLARQLSVWKKYADKHPSYKNILGRELQVFNRAMSLQFQENAMWAVIDANLGEIEKLSEENQTEASQSFTRSALYTSLLISYIGLNDFYKEKYKELITLSTLSHATQENPQLNLPEDILNQIKPLHAQELKDAKVLIYDQKNNIDKIKEIGAQTKEIKDFYKKVNQYSISEIDKIISNLQKETKNLKPNATNFLAENKMEPLIDDYINYYSSLKSQLEEQVLAQEMEDAALVAMYDKELTQLAYTGMLYPGMEYAGIGDWASSAWNAVKTGTKIATGAGFAVVDYTTGKISETICEVTDKAGAMYDKGVFSDEYKQWSQAYDQAGDGKSIVSIKDTFINPTIATLKGDDKHGLGQSAVNKAQGSFSTVDKYASGAIKTVVGNETAANIISQAALNVATCGGYGLAKDYTTINDANASTGQKVVAGAGILLAVVPAISGAKVANDATKNTVKSAVKNTSQVMDDVGQAIAHSNAASSTLKNATKNLAGATDDMIKAAGPNLSKADVLDDVFNAAAQNFDNALINKVTSQVAYNQAQQTVKNTIRDGLINAPIKTIKDAVKDTFADWSLSGLKNQAIQNVKSAYQDSLTQVIKDSTPFFGQSIGNAIGIKDIANFTLTNFVNNNITGSITTTMDAILNPKNDNKGDNKPATPSTQTSDPASTTPPEIRPTKYPGGDHQPPVVVPTAPPIGQGPSIVPTAPPYGPQPYPPNVTVQAPATPWDPGMVPQTPGYPIQPPYGPQQQTPGYTNPDLLNQYLQGQNNNQNTPPNFNPGDFDSVLTMHQQNQQNLNDNRGQQNTNPPGYAPQQTFDTDVNSGGTGNSISQHVQQLSTQTGQWHQQNQNRPQPTPTPNPQSTTAPSSSTPPSGIPVGDGVPEQDRTNGIDDDNDGVIDEGPATGSFQMAIHDTGGDKDDQWDIKVDGQSVGRNNQGKTRFWDMNLASGQHTISATGVAIPDNVGTYTIWFGNSQVVSGPSLTGRNLNQGTTFTWTIRVP